MGAVYQVGSFPMTTLIIDADSIAYMAGACEERDHAIHACNKKLAQIREAVGPHDTEILVCEDHRVSRRCFRYQVAVSRPYKGHRKPCELPHVDMVKEHMCSLDTYQPVPADLESDDCVAMWHQACDKNAGGWMGSMRLEGQSGGSIIAHVDKDLDQLPGRHYNYKAGSLYTVPTEKSVYNLCSQMLTGDTADNIPGLPRSGLAHASKVLDPLFGTRPAHDMLKAVVSAYVEKGMPYSYFIEQARLLYLKRHSKDVFAWPEEDYR